MRKIIFDTDMGVDCDDAAALAILLNAHKKKECKIEAITASSTREGATATIKVICDYYGVKTDIGAMSQPSIPCDSMNNYSFAVKNKYNETDVETDAVRLIRKKLASSSEKITLIAVGPLTNVARVLKSEPDDVSDKSGIELVKEKVDVCFVMGGSFSQNKQMYANIHPEWNIVQDIFSAQTVTNEMPIPMIFCPFEAGINVFTVMGKGDNPVWYCMYKYAENNKYPYEDGFLRPSWDPITVLCAIDDISEFFALSSNGFISVKDNGETLLEENESGMHRILLLKENYIGSSTLVNAKIPR